MSRFISTRSRLVLLSSFLIAILIGSNLALIDAIVGLAPDVRPSLR